MKKDLFFVFALALLQFTASAQAPALLKDDGSSGFTPATSVFEDANGLVGIGTTGPAALLHIDNHTSSTTDYFSITRTTITPPPNFSAVSNPLFTVNTDGFVGIGTATPQVLFDVKAKAPANTTDLLDNPPAFAITDQNDAGIFGVWNFTNGSHRGAGLFISGYDDLDPNTPLYPALVVLDETNGRLPFAVASNGIIAAGHDVTNGFTPISQIDFRKFNNYDYLLNVGGPNGLSDTYFNVSNDGNVGIGTANTGNATLEIVRNSTNQGSVAQLSIVAPSTVPRFIYAGTGSSPASGSTYFSVKPTGTGIGIDDLSTGSTLALKGIGSSLTLFDMYPNGGYPALMRFVSSAGAVRHVITEADNNLYILPGGGGNANNKMVVDGALTVTGKVSIGTEAPNGSYSNYQLGVDGNIVAKKVIVQTASWADNVFDANYPLPTLQQVSNYIAQHKHLPEIPDECQVTEQGVDVGEMNRLLLKKIEELTLYVIAQQEQINALTKK